MTHVSDHIDLRTPDAPPVLHIRDLRAHLDRIPANGWTPARDLLLADGLVRGNGLARTAALLGTSAEDANMRWRAITRPFATYTHDHKRNVTIDGQRMLIAELRARVTP